MLDQFLVTRREQSEDGQRGCGKAEEGEESKMAGLHDEAGQCGG